MQTKSLALLALAASSALASPFHKRQDAAHHHRFHGTGRPSGTSVRPTGSGSPFAAGNDTDGVFAPTAGSGTATLVLTKTVSPVPAGSGVNTFGNVAASSETPCVTTKIVTETSTNVVIVTASPVANTKAVEANGNSVAAGGFYGGQGSRSYGGGYGQSQGAPAAPTSAAASIQPAPGNPSTTLATSVKSSAPSASAGGSSGVSSSGGKRGISYNDAGLVSAFAGKVSWAYNWGATSGGLNGVEFVPMCWGKDNVNSFASSVGSATHVLSFNEPDLGTQSNIDAATAAKLHKQVFSGLKGKVQVGSPAVTNGVKNPDGTPMGVPYLDAFFSACGSNCPVDFVAFHWYATADNFAYFKQHVQDVIDVANKYGVNKVWLTEFQPEGGADAQAAFMAQAVPFLEGTPAVERYAAFMASDGTLLSGKSLNTLGKAYVGA